ncbi:MAG TPA: hypothetical protein VEA63_15235, partial [Opitutus sp.]|nr:hypothetical protein [Opitutus sp.]
RRMLLQAMSEERATGYATEDAGEGLKRIVSVGTDPWQVRALSGTVAFKKAEANELKVTALDFNGRPQREVPLGANATLALERATTFYLIERR